MSTMMMSESERVTRASETRFRIQSPNSRPRSFRVIALDAFSAHLVDRVCGDPSRNIAYRQAEAGVDLSDWLAGADVVAIVARAGTEPAAAQDIARYCTAHGIMVTGVVIDPLTEAEPAGQATVAGLRPNCSMLVIASDADYLEEMLDALGARR